MKAAAQRVLDIALRQAAAGRTMAHAAMAGAPSCTAHRHYPAGDLHDTASGCRYFYHAHGRGGGEHGHFHLFVDVPGQPGFAHLAGLSLDPQGQPLRWFTTDAWVTGEQPLPAPALLARLAGFRIQARGRLAPVADWLSAMVQLFEPQLARLIARRDQALARHAAKGQADGGYRQRRTELLSSCDASLARRLQASDLSNSH